MQRTTRGASLTSRRHNDVRLRGQSVFVDQPAKQIAAADAIEVNDLGGPALVERRRLLERWPLLVRAVRAVLVVGR